MLSFTDAPGTRADPTAHRPFQYFQVSNHVPTPPRVPTRPKKNIVKTMQPKAQTHKSSAPQPRGDKEFTHQTSHPKLFDERLKRNELAAEERRIHGELKKMNKEVPTEEHQNTFSVEKEVGSQQHQRLKSAQQKKTSRGADEIEHLKGLIEREKKDKMRNDKEFEQKERAIEDERRKLKMIENQLRKTSNPSYQLAENRPKDGNKQVAPTNDNIQQPKYADPQQARAQKQKQLHALMGRRQRLEKYTNPFNYTPTLIPLLSRCSYKIISTHISTLTELLIDDLLLEQVLVLEEIEEEERKVQERGRQRMVLEDFVDKVGELVRDNDLIENRVGNYEKLSLTEWHKPNSYSPAKESTAKYEQYDSLTLYLTEDSKRRIYKNKDTFEKFTKYRDEYDRKNERMFQDATEEVIEQIVNSLVKELDKGSEEFVEAIFRHEFK